MIGDALTEMPLWAQVLAMAAPASAGYGVAAWRARTERLNFYNSANQKLITSLETRMNSMQAALDNCESLHRNSQSEFLALNRVNVTLEQQLCTVSRDLASLREQLPSMHQDAEVMEAMIRDLREALLTVRQYSPDTKGSHTSQENALAETVHAHIIDRR